MANVKISELSLATTPLTGTESIPLVQGGATVKTTAQDIADLGGGSGGTANYATAQIIGASGSPSATYNFNTLFPTIVFTDVAVSMTMQIVVSDGQFGSNFGSYLYNIIRTNSNSPSWNYGSAYTSQTSGAPSPVSFIFSGTEAAPTLEFYISGGYTASFNFTIITTV
jgi:hypothetical protein